MLTLVNQLYRYLVHRFIHKFFSSLPCFFFVLVINWVLLTCLKKRNELRLQRARVCFSLFRGSARPLSPQPSDWLVKLKQAEQLTPKHHVRYFKERRVRAHPTTPSLPLWSDPPVSSIPRVQTIPATSPYNCLASLFDIFLHFN